MRSDRTTREADGRDRRGRWGVAIPLVMLLALSLSATSGRAATQLDLTITPGTSTVTSASPTGSFDVDLTNNSGSAIDVSDFSLVLTLPSSSGVIFTAADIPSSNYIFGNGAGYVGAGPPFYTVSADEVTGGDSVLLLSPPNVSIANGTTVGLAVISFDASGATPGVLNPITFAAGTSADYYDVSTGTTVPITLNYSSPGGYIQLAGAVVPEPSTVMLLAIGLAPVLLACRRRSPGGLRPGRTSSRSEGPTIEGV